MPPAPNVPTRVPDKVISADVAARRGPTVVALMIEVMRKVTFVGKDQRNTEQRFDFRGIDIGLFSPGAKVSAEYAPKAAKAGCVVA